MAEEGGMSALVGEALAKRALGYQIEEVKETIEEDHNGKRKTKTERVRKAMAPDLEAIKLMRAYQTEQEGVAITVVTQAPRPGERPRPKRRAPARKAGAGDADED